MKRTLVALWFVVFAFVAARSSAAEPGPLPRLIPDRDALFRKPQILDLTIELDKPAAESLRKMPRPGETTRSR